MPRRFKAAIGMLLSLSVLTACASSGNNADQDLKLGVLLPYTGVYSTLGEAVTNGMELYFDQVGYKAGGRKIVLVKEDTEAKNDVGLRKARKLVEQDKVDLMTGVVSSGVAVAIRDYIHDSETITVIASAGADIVTREKKSPFIFRVSYTNWQIAAAEGEWAAKNLGKKAVTLQPDYAAGKDNVQAFRETYEPAGGKVVKDIYYPLGNSDFGPYLAQVKAENPDFVFAFGAGADAVRLLNAWKDFRMTVPLIAPGHLVDEHVLDEVKENALGIYSSLHWAYTLGTPENKNFITAYEKRFGKAPNSYAVTGYEAGQFIVEALNQVQGNTKDKQAVMKAMKSVSFNGPRGQFKLDPETQNVILTMYIRKVEKVDGRITNQVLQSLPNFKDPGKTR